MKFNLTFDEMSQPDAKYIICLDADGTERAFLELLFPEQGSIQLAKTSDAFVPINMKHVQYTVKPYVIDFDATRELRESIEHVDLIHRNPGYDGYVEYNVTDVMEPQVNIYNGVDISGQTTTFLDLAFSAKQIYHFINFHDDKGYIPMGIQWTHNMIMEHGKWVLYLLNEEEAKDHKFKQRQKGQKGTIGDYNETDFITRYCK